MDTRSSGSPIRRLSLGLALAAAAGSLAAQATASVPCTARIRPAAAADYDLSSEVVLRGRVVGREGRLLLLRIAAGIVRVDAGASVAAAALAADTTIEVVAAKQQVDGRQRLLAREIRQGGGSLLVLRDGQGVPVRAAGQL